ncbi:amidase [Variovorax sp. Sphag1AA]|uniref:amidase n=1 Tax=Variovorax sp. Sphag1AA TaxID=2587027 RepID=UPI00161072D4|nr:amidase [Variovorax sp. Sphag1AA]MBB3181592.1 aspartyl-tRNA(Asn)/glutamyl-tRNA(Gln) amidotransferase subunit A [Variovorax sp. Sphag1AA]
MSHVHQSSTAASRSPTLRTALDALATRRITAVELIEQSLQSAEACKRTVNAFSIVDWDRAMAAAADSDLRYAQGTQRPLEGLPIGVKDLIDTKDLETRYGSAAYLGHVPTADADIVRALVEQGAIPIGKTSTHEFAWGVTTTSSVFGDTLNPLDKQRIAGGSSGGAAAAIAFGSIAAGLGTDTGGSVRIPAALCDIVGFKPTFGTLSTRGIFPLAPTLDHPGLLGATVDDVVLLAKALQIEFPPRNASASARLGVIRGIAPVPPSPEVASAFGNAIDCINEAVECVEVDAAASGLFDKLYDAFASIVLTEGAIEHFRRNDWDRIVTHYGAETVERLQRAKKLELRAYAEAQETRRSFAANLHRVMSTVDYLVLPTCPCTAPLRHAQSTVICDWSGTVREALMTYTAPFNLAGFPAISIPLTHAGCALPASLQIVARPGQDGALLRLAAQLESIARVPSHRTEP